jgi:hypothetical protein
MEEKLVILIKSASEKIFACAAYLLFFDTTPGAPTLCTNHGLPIMELLKKSTEFLKGD